MRNKATRENPAVRQDERETVTVGPFERLGLPAHVAVRIDFGQIEVPPLKHRYAAYAASAEGTGKAKSGHSD